MSSGEIILGVLLFIVIILALFLVFLLRRERGPDWEKLLSAEESRMREELARLRLEQNQALRGLSEELQQQLDRTGGSNEQRLDNLRRLLDEKLGQIQEGNEKKLDAMRLTVDEKLHKSLEQRLGESFSQVSERLEKVHQGLGEMQSLAVKVGDLQRVLVSSPLRGVWGEINLESILCQLLSPEQYRANVAVKPSAPKNRVEFAIVLPGQGQQVYLPIDAKFPLADYENLLQAQDQGDKAKIEAAGKALEKTARLVAKEVGEKYLEPPFTTDFAIIFLPIEGLYGELLRRPGLADGIQRQYRVILSGPTTLAALLNSLQMGFQSLAVQERASEVWQLLANVKTGFSDFGLLLEKTQKKLQEAVNSTDEASRKARSIERKLQEIVAPTSQSEV